MRIWKQIKSHFKMEPIFYALPIAGSPAFAPSYLDNTFKLWTLVTGHSSNLSVQGIPL